MIDPGRIKSEISIRYRFGPSAWL